MGVHQIGHTLTLTVVCQPRSFLCLLRQWSTTHTGEKVDFDISRDLLKGFRGFFYRNQHPSHNDLVCLSSKLVLRRNSYGFGDSLIFCKPFLREWQILLRLLPICKRCWLHTIAWQAYEDFGCRINLCLALSNHIRELYCCSVRWKRIFVGLLGVFFPSVFLLIDIFCLLFLNVFKMFISCNESYDK